MEMLKLRKMCEIIVSQGFIFLTFLFKNFSFLFVMSALWLQK